MADDKDSRAVQEYLSQQALQFRRRADESATVLRGFLFALSAAGAGFAANAADGGPLGWHLASIASFAVAIVLIVFSWHVQKGKSLARQEAAESGDPEKLRELDAFLKKFKSNHVVDRITYVFVALGFAAELVLLMLK